VIDEYAVYRILGIVGLKFLNGIRTKDVIGLKVHDSKEFTEILNQNTQLK